MNVRKLPPVRKTVTAYSLTEVFQPITPWMSTLEAATAIRGTVALFDKTGNFQCRPAIQVAVKSERDVNAPTSIASHATQMGTGGTEQFVSFNPNDATDGNIDSGSMFRFGFFYSLSAGSTPAVGTIGTQNLALR